MTEKAYKSGARRSKSVERSPVPAREDRWGRGPQSATPGAGGSAGATRWALQLQRQAGNQAVGRVLGSRQPEGGDVDEVLRTAGQPLPHETRSEMEARLGADFSKVRIHADAAADAAARSVQAHAFTSGPHVVFRHGAYDTTSAAGERLLAHELTHVLQQRAGAVAGTDRGDGLRVSDPSDRFEREAEVSTQRAMSRAIGIQRTIDSAAQAPYKEGQKEFGGRKKKLSGKDKKLLKDHGVTEEEKDAINNRLRVIRLGSQQAEAIERNRAKLRQALADSSDVSIETEIGGRQIEVHLDNDQLPHQHPKHRIGTRQQANKTKLSSKADEQWHKSTTLEYMAHWAADLDLTDTSKHENHNQGLNIRGFAYEGFFLQVDGKRYVFFHCYPRNKNDDFKIP